MPKWQKTVTFATYCCTYIIRARDPCDGIILCINHLRPGSPPVPLPRPAPHGVPSVTTDREASPTPRDATSGDRETIWQKKQYTTHIDAAGQEIEVKDINSY